VLRALIAIGGRSRSALADMTPYISMNYGSLSQAPEFLVRGMASLDPVASIALIQKAAQRPSNDLFDQRGQQARGAINRIKQIQLDIEHVKSALAAGKDQTLQQDRARESVLEWASALRSGDSIDRVICLLGTPARVNTVGELEYTDLEQRISTESSAPLRVRIRGGKIASIVLPSRSESSNQR